LFAALPAAAFDPFEIQVYDGSASPPGVFGLELHLNYVPKGIATTGTPQLAPEHQFHFTFEPSLGITRFWELGAYVQFAVLPDGSARIAGGKLRSKFVVPEGTFEHLRLGINFEVSRIPAAFEEAEWGGEIRPIIAWEDDRWLFAANPNIGLAFSGSDQRPSFEPCAMAKVKLGEAIAAGVEYYGSTGALFSVSPLLDQEHYVFAAADLLNVRRVELNVGAGAGLTRSSNDVIVKAIFGWTFE
jgi:hypothetical protein